MISPSRKKHQTTPPNTKVENRADQSRFDMLVGPEGPTTMDDHGQSSLAVRHSSYDDATWLPAALLATLVLLVSALQSFGGEPAQLQWRAAQSPSNQSNHPVKHISTAKADASGYAVVQVGYEEVVSPSVSVSGSARLKSVVVHPRDSRFDGPEFANHLAQNPFDDDDEISRGINLPFGQEPSELDDLPEPTAPGVQGEIPEPTDPGLFDEIPEPTAPKPLEEMPEPTQPINGIEDTTTPGAGINRDADPSRPTPRALEKYDEERAAAMETCDKARDTVLSDVISNISLNISQTGKEGLDYPFECMLDDGRAYNSRNWPEVTYMWKAAANCHKPLYFEQVQLERYGHSWGPCVQPLVSGAHFFTRLPVLPYCMGITPPNECLYPLGYYRPGNCAPYMIDAVPFTWRAAAFQAGATVGTAAILP